MAGRFYSNRIVRTRQAIAVLRCTIWAGLTRRSTGCAAQSGCSRITRRSTTTSARRWVIAAKRTPPSSASRAALALDPAYAQAHTNLGMALLGQGDFPAGWREYEWRWAIPTYRPRPVPAAAMARRAGTRAHPADPCGTRLWRLDPVLPVRHAGCGMWLAGDAGGATGPGPLAAQPARRAPCTRTRRNAAVVRPALPDAQPARRGATSDGQHPGGFGLSARRGWPGGSLARPAGAVSPGPAGGAGLGGQWRARSGGDRPQALAAAVLVDRVGRAAGSAMGQPAKDRPRGAPGASHHRRHGGDGGFCRHPRRWWKRWTWLSRWTRRSLISPPPWASRCGCWTASRRAGAGLRGGRTAHGTQRCASCASPARATGAAWLRNWARACGGVPRPHRLSRLCRYRRDCRWRAGRRRWY